MNVSNKMKDISASIVLIVFSVFGYFYCVKHTLPQEGDIGSMYLPKIIFVCLLILSIIKLIGAINMKSRANVSSKTKIDKKIFAQGIATIIATGIYCCFFNEIGFLASTFIYLVVQMGIFVPSVKENWKRILVVSVMTTVAVEVIFVELFEMIMPAGILSGIL